MSGGTEHEARGRLMLPEEFEDIAKRLHEIVAEFDGPSIVAAAHSLAAMGVQKTQLTMGNETGVRAAQVLVNRSIEIYHEINNALAAEVQAQEAERRKKMH